MRVVVSVLSLWFFFGSVGCGRKAAEQRAAGGRTGTNAASGRQAVSPRDAGKSVSDDRHVVSGQKPAVVSADSPTGLAICDRYLKTVCACAAKDPVLKKACNEGTKSAPQWKQTSGKDPEQRRVVSESCRQALKMVEESFGCKQ